MILTEWTCTVSVAMMKEDLVQGARAELAVAHVNLVVVCVKLVKLNLYLLINTD